MALEVSVVGAPGWDPQKVKLDLEIAGTLDLKKRIAETQGQRP
jgi:hypothetical protein